MPSGAWVSVCDIVCGCVCVWDWVFVGLSGCLTDWIFLSI